MVEVSTMHLIKVVSSTIKPPASNSAWDKNRGHPLAMFISDFGFLNAVLIGSGWKVSIISLPPAWLMSLKVILCVNGHWRTLSNSPCITTKNSER